MKICITVCTRERPVLLRKCLESVCAQEIPEGVEADIAVIENHREDISRFVTEEVARETGWTIHYVLEPEMGIPFARNRCGTFAADAGYDRLLYIDDDEVAHEGWLRRMVEATKAYPAEVHYGRVVYTYPPVTPSWMIPDHANKRPTGSELRKAEGHNTFVDTAVFRKDGFGLSFDGGMRFSGGSDTDFFSRVHDAGGKIVWIAEAVVEELVPENRVTLRWQLHRTFRVACNISRLHEKRAGKPKAMVKSLVKGIGRLANGVFLQAPASLVFLVSPERGRRQAFKAAKQVASALGSLGYLIGHQPQPYRKVDGN